MEPVVFFRTCRARGVEEVRKRYLHQARGKGSVRGVCVFRELCAVLVRLSLSESLSFDRKPLSRSLSPLVELENDSGTVARQAAVAEYSQGLCETGVGRSRAASRDERGKVHDLRDVRSSAPPVDQGLELEVIGVLVVHRVSQEILGREPMKARVCGRETEFALLRARLPSHQPPRGLCDRVSSR